MPRLINNVLNLVRDKNGLNTYLLSQTDQIYEALLVADTPKSLTVPLTKGNDANWVAVIQREDGNTIYTAINALAKAPSSTEFTLTGSYGNVPGISVQAGDVISVMTPDADARVTVLLYSGVTQ